MITPRYVVVGDVIELEVPEGKATVYVTTSLRKGRLTAMVEIEGRDRGLAWIDATAEHVGRLVGSATDLLESWPEGLRGHLNAAGYYWPGQELPQPVLTNGQSMTMSYSANLDIDSSSFATGESYATGGNVAMLSPATLYGAVCAVWGPESPHAATLTHLMRRVEQADYPLMMLSLPEEKRPLLLPGEREAHWEDPK